MSLVQAKIIDGKKLAEKILFDLSVKVKKMDRRPGLAAIMIGDDPASKLYVENKKKACLKVGINFYDYFCGGVDHPNDTEEDILKSIDYLNNDPNTDGIIVQIPIPKKFNTTKIINQIDPKKDVDGFHPQNNQEFSGNNFVITPPLIMAVNKALNSTKQTLTGKEAIILSKNPIFSEPMKKNLTAQGLKVQAIKPEKDFEKITKQADVLIVIVGQPGIIKKDMVKLGAIVIDIGTTLIAENKWAGDVSPEVKNIAGWLTPVPGGIGPLTVAMLLQGTYDIARNNQ